MQNLIKYIFHMFQKYQIFCGSNWKKKMWKLLSPEEEQLVTLSVTTDQKILVKVGRTKFTKSHVKIVKRYTSEKPSQWFDERESQHKHAVSNKDTTNGIAQHVYETSHIINWQKAKLIDSHKYQRNRKIKWTGTYKCFCSWKWRFWMLDEPRYGNLYWPDMESMQFNHKTTVEK